MSSSGWCTIESDPGVFTELINNIGVKNAQVEEIYSMDEGSFQAVRPVHGLIFLFKWTEATKSSSASTVEPPPGLFFAKQTIQNACGTQAILNILLNAENLELGDELSRFKEFTAEFPAEMKGMCISNSEVMRRVHNSFARQEDYTLEQSTRRATKDDDVYHFVAYLPFKGHVYELDGLLDGPIDLGEYGGDDWLEKARPAVQQRMERYASGEIHFALMAVVDSIRARAEAELVEAEAALARAQATPDGDVAAATERVDSLRVRISAEQEKFSQYHIENERRKHNYIPFIIRFLEALARNGQLLPALNEQIAAAKSKK